MKTYKILGKRGRITIPFEIRQEMGFAYNDVISFERGDGGTVRSDRFRSRPVTKSSDSRTVRINIKKEDFTMAATTTTTTTPPLPATTIKPFDIYEYVAYAKEYGESLGLNYRDTLAGTSWNAPQRIRASMPDEIIRAGVRASLDILAMENMTYFKLYLDEELDRDGYYSY